MSRGVCAVCIAAHNRRASTAASSGTGVMSEQSDCCAQLAEAPLVLDGTKPWVSSTAVKWYPGDIVQQYSTTAAGAPPCSPLVCLLFRKEKHGTRIYCCSLLLDVSAAS